MLNFQHSWQSWSVVTLGIDMTDFASPHRNLALLGSEFPCYSGVAVPTIGMSPSHLVAARFRRIRSYIYTRLWCHVQLSLRTCSHHLWTQESRPRPVVVILDRTHRQCPGQYRHWSSPLSIWNLRSCVFYNRNHNVDEHDCLCGHQVFCCWLDG
jgi:hypothetical protein